MQDKARESGRPLQITHPAALRLDGAVESVTMKMSSGDAVIDQHLMRVLKTYRFKPGTRQPIEWLVGFIQPNTVIVKLNLVTESAAPSRPKKK